MNLFGVVAGILVSARPVLIGSHLHRMQNKMSLWQRWTNLPVKARYYIAGSTFVFALLGDYVTTKINEEVVAQKEIMDEVKSSS